MPPKKDDKKKGKGAGTYTPKEINPQHYIRPSIPLPSPSPEQQLHSPLPRGKILNSETLFPVWPEEAGAGDSAALGLDEEGWQAPPVTYPSALGVDHLTTLKEFYHLLPSAEEEAAQKKKKDNNKRASKANAMKKDGEEQEEQVEVVQGEDGQPLPIVYRDNTTFNLCPPLPAFRKKPIPSYASRSTDASVDSNYGGGEGGVSEDWVDPLVCEAFRLVWEFASRLFHDYPSSSTGSSSFERVSTVEQLEKNYLWRAIYPKLPSGKPCFNPAGRYAVRLFWAGRWRKVIVDDSLPLCADGQPALAMTTDEFEIWPLILSKAIYTVYTATMYDPATYDSSSSSSSSNNNNSTVSWTADHISQFLSFAVHLLTGWHPHHATDAVHLFSTEKSKSLKLVRNMIKAGMAILPHHLLPEENSRYFLFKGQKNKNSPDDDDDIVGGSSNNNSHHRDHVPFQSSSGDIQETEQKEEDIAAVLPEGGEEERGDLREMVIKTKRQFKAEYQARRRVRQEIEQAIIKREEQLDELSTLLSTSTEEAFCLLLFNQEKMRFEAWPILALVFPSPQQDEDLSTLQGEHLMEIRFLLSWSRGEKEEIQPAVDDPILLGRNPLLPPSASSPSSVMVEGGNGQQGDVPPTLVEFLRPYPKASPLRWKWVSLREVVHRSSAAHLFALFTFSRAGHHAIWSQHWQPLTSTSPAASTTTPAGKGGKEKSVKKTAQQLEEEQKQQEVVYVCQGQPPVTLMVLETAQLAAAAATGGEESAKLKREEEEQDDELREALAAQEEALKQVTSEQQQEQENVEGGGVEEEQPIAFFNVDSTTSLATTATTSDAVGLVFTITIHADRTFMEATPPNTGQEQDHEGEEDKEEEKRKPLSRGMAPRQMSWDAAKTARQEQVLPSETVLLIQELRLDDQEPLVFLLELSDTSQFPIISKAFTIPKHRLPRVNSSSAPMFFWLRLFTKASIYVSVQTSVEVRIGLAEEIWRHGSLVCEGDNAVTVQGTDQLLFRLPFTIASSPTELQGQGQEKEGQEVVVPPQRKVSESISTKALIFLHVADPNLQEHVHLLLVSYKQGQSSGWQELAEQEGQVVDISQKTAFQEMLVAYTHTQTSQQQLPGFHWKLVILSYLPLVLPTDRKVQEEEVKQRFEGRYFANRRYCLFRDIYSIEKPSFPLSWRLSVRALEGLGKVESIDGVPIVLRLLHHDTVIASYSGENILHCYYQDLSKLVNGGEGSSPTPVVPTTPAAGKGGAAAAAAPGKGKAGATPAAPTIDTVDIIFECCLDVDRISDFPDFCYSRYPHAFDEHFEKKADNNEHNQQPAVVALKETLSLQNDLLATPPPSQPLLEWSLDILSGKVVQVQHDVTPLIRFATVKNSWEEKNAGQTERAMAAMAYVQERLKVFNPHKVNATLAAAAAAVGGPAVAVTGGGTGLPAEAPPDLVYHMVDLTPSMADNVSMALNGEAEEVQPRFDRLHRLPRFEEKVELIPPQDTTLETLTQSLINPFNLVGEIGSQPWLEAAQSRRLNDKQHNEAVYQRIRARGIEYTESYREELRQRLQDLQSSQLAGRLALAQAWNERERYRYETESKNASLAYLLKRAKEAKQTAKDMEIAAALEQQKLEAKKAKKK